MSQAKKKASAQTTTLEKAPQKVAVEETKATAKTLPVTTTNQNKKYMTETETETDSAVSDAVESVKPIVPPGPPTAEEKEAKLRSIKTRTISSIMMFSGFLLIITMGHIYCAILVLNLAFFMYKEIISLKRKDEKDRKNNLFSFIDWYYFTTFAFLMIPNLFLRRVLVEDAIPAGTILHLIVINERGMGGQHNGLDPHLNGQGQPIIAATGSHMTKSRANNVPFLGPASEAYPIGWSDIFSTSEPT